jgi:DNA-binding winged helix-turn-helix (wHTH) protein/Flp pilus assembly protein TadD
MDRRYVIGNFEIEPAARRLLRRDGQVVALAKRPFQVLLYLTENRERLVSREELLSRFWGGRDVYENALTRCLSTVRKALDDDRGAPARYIETRWAQGYRFIGPFASLATPAIDTRVIDTRVIDTQARVATIFRSRDVDGRAAELCRLGRAYLSQHGARSQRYAIKMFKRALAIDPEDAVAWAGFATARVSHYLWAETTPEDRRLAAAASDRAIELNPYLPEAYVARAYAAAALTNHAAADVAFAQAQSLDPNLFDAWYFQARSCASRGEHDRAIAMYEAAQSVRPQDFRATALSRMCYTSLGLHDGSNRLARRSVALAEELLSVRPDDADMLSFASCMLHHLGRHDEMSAWLDRATALDPDEPSVNYRAACAYALAGQPERALAYLERVPLVPERRRWIANDSDLDSLRSQPRFRALVFPEEQQS